MNPSRVLEQSTIWLSTVRSSARGRAARDYVVYDDAGSPALVAQTSAWDRTIVVTTAAEPQQIAVVLRRRVLFPLTGRVDILDASGTRLGVVTRTGRYTTPDGTEAGRFRDARSFGSRARESVVVGVLDALLAGDGSTSHVSGPTGFVWLVGSQVMGTLARARLPFSNETSPSGTTPASSSSSRVIAFMRRVRAAAATRPAGWKLERLQADAPSDPRLILAAALFTIELSHW